MSVRDFIKISQNSLLGAKLLYDLLWRSVPPCIYQCCFNAWETNIPVTFSTRYHSIVNLESVLKQWATIPSKRCSRVIFQWCCAPKSSFSDNNWYQNEILPKDIASYRGLVTEKIFALSCNLSLYSVTNVSMSLFYLL